MRNVRTAVIGFGILLLLVAGIAIVAIYGLRATVKAESQARQEEFAVVQVVRLRFLFEQKVATSRAFLLTGESRFLEETRLEREQLRTVVDSLRKLLQTEEGQQLLEHIVAVEKHHQDAFERIAQRIGGDGGGALVARLFLQEMKPARDRADTAFVALARHKQERTDARHAEAIRAERRWVGWITGASAVALVLGIVLTIFLTRVIVRQAEAERRVREDVLAQAAEVERAMLAMRVEHTRALERNREPGRTS